MMYIRVFGRDCSVITSYSPAINSLQNLSLAADISSSRHLRLYCPRIRYFAMIYESPGEDGRRRRRCWFIARTFVLFNYDVDDGKHCPSECNVNTTFTFVLRAFACQVNANLTRNLAASGRCTRCTSAPHCAAMQVVRVSALFRPERNAACELRVKVL